MATGQILEQSWSEVSENYARALRQGLALRGAVSSCSAPASSVSTSPVPDMQSKRQKTHQAQIMKENSYCDFNLNSRLGLKSQTVFELPDAVSCSNNSMLLCTIKKSFQLKEDDLAWLQLLIYGQFFFIAGFLERKRLIAQQLLTHFVEYNVIRAHCCKIFNRPEDLEKLHENRVAGIYKGRWRIMRTDNCLWISTITAANCWAIVPVVPGTAASAGICHQLIMLCWSAVT